ncbi:MAG: trans-aconitate 2-methyltransferase [Gemmataceae bacterium]
MSRQPDYRWNQAEQAQAYDQAAEHIHPFYLELQALILDQLPFNSEASFLFVDLGGGSGRLAELVLERYRAARVLVLDQSQPFLDIAKARLDKFTGRGLCGRCRLQDSWHEALAETPAVIASMSAIHHLDPDEKRELYRRCHATLAPGGLFLNADEVRSDDAADYLARCRAWAEHMHRIIEAGLVPEPMAHGLRAWEERNVARFGQPRQSGDDCHETIERQLDYLRDAGFADVDAPWHKEMWAVLRARKA